MFDPFNLPPEALSLLRSIVTYHRRCEQYPVQFVYAYVQGDIANQVRQDAYNQAIVLIGGIVDQISETDSSFKDAWQEWKILEFCRTPEATERLRALPERVKKAHAIAAYTIKVWYDDIRHALELSLPEDSEVLAMYPELKDRFTKRDHLLPLANDLTLGHAWLNYKESELLVHPGFRRNYHDRVHYELLASLKDLKQRGLNVAIAPDHEHVAPRGTFPEIHEKDHWFGRPYQSSTLDDELIVGKVLHARESATQESGLLTQFNWFYQDGLKSFVAEELPDPEKSTRHGFVLCRFVHAQRDIVHKRFIHLDGAISLYTPDHYRERRAQALSGQADPVYADRKIKLFRVDAITEDPQSCIPEADWTNVITQFFRKNELVVEYFTGQTMKSIYEEEYAAPYPGPEWL
jgi:hypothetical protein